MNRLKFVGIASIIIFVFACLPQLAIAKRKCPKNCSSNMPTTTPITCPSPIPTVCPKERTQVRWDMAVEIIKSGIVVVVSQTHSLDVVLSLKDGTQFITKEPNIDAVFAVIDQCGLPCQDILQATE